MFYFVDFQIQEHDLHNLCLLEVKELLNSNGRALTDYSCLPQPDLSNSFKFQNLVLPQSVPIAFIYSNISCPIMFSIIIKVYFIQ